MSLDYSIMIDAAPEDITVGALAMAMRARKLAVEIAESQRVPTLYTALTSVGIVTHKEMVVTNCGAVDASTVLLLSVRDKERVGDALDECVVVASVVIGTLDADLVVLYLGDYPLLIRTDRALIVSDSDFWTDKRVGLLSYEGPRRQLKLRNSWPTVR